MALPLPNKITSLEQIILAGSPHHVHVSTSTLQPAGSISLSLWIWTGSIDKPHYDNANPNVILAKARINDNDTYISFEISQYIKSFLNPKLFYDQSIISMDEGVYVQYTTSLLNYAGVVVSTTTYPTKYATLGYNWDYENENTFNWNNGSFGVNTSSNVTDTVPTVPVSGTEYYSRGSNMVPRFYSPHIQYYNPKINLNASYSNDVIRRDELIPTTNVRCSKDPYMIVYLNKMGLWDLFTPDGKVVISNKSSRDTYSAAIRNARAFNNEIDHQTKQYNLQTDQSYIINTGWITEQMGQIVEEILYSPKVYLIKYDKNSVALPGITADNNIISADNNIISADNMSGANGYYSKYQQIPVMVTDSDFSRKTRLNDKNKINYNLKFTGTNEKINAIR